MNAALSSAPSASEIDPRLGVLIDELTNRLHAGERVEIEDYVRRYPDLAERIRRLIPALEIVATDSNTQKTISKNADFTIKPPTDTKTAANTEKAAPGR